MSTEILLIYFLTVRPVVPFWVCMSEFFAFLWLVRFLDHDCLTFYMIQDAHYKISNGLKLEILCFQT
jgi:hypothetical protein